jgi:Xaa-Pro dipeptidase
MLLNRARADHIMEQHKLDGLVASFKENIYYLSDYWGPMFLMSRNFTLYAVLPRDPSAPAALIMPGSGVYHLEHRPTWMPNISTYVTRLRPGAIPPRDFESSTEEIVEDQEDFVPQGTAIMPYKTRPGSALAPRDHQLLARYDRHADRPHKTALLALKGAIKTAASSTRASPSTTRACSVG